MNPKPPTRVADEQIRVPKSAIRQNLIYTIESLTRRIDQVEGALTVDPKNNVSASFFEGFLSAPVVSRRI